MIQYVLIGWCCFFMLSGCENTNLELAAEAGLDAFRAATLSDGDVRILADRASRQSDQKNSIAPGDSPYGKRLRTLTGNGYAAAGVDFNFKVYLSKQVNAFAMADGTIRIYSGLMDMMNDEELLFVVGHEMGHVVKNHIRKKIMLAYAASALRKGVASQENLAGAIAGSALGGFVQTLVNAQFSQAEEREADDFGMAYLTEKKTDPMAAVSALKKLAALGSNHSFLSSHPAPEVRAKRLHEQIVSAPKVGEPSFLEHAVSVIKGFLLTPKRVNP